MRITSRINFVTGIIGLLLFLFVPVQFFWYALQSQPVWLIVALEAVFALYTWLFLNCVDIYQEADDSLRCYFYGRRFEVPASSRIGKIPFAVIHSGFKYYILGYLSFRTDVGKRRLKFFVVADRDWHLIKENELI
jgi:hypothetical protein